MTNFAQKDHEGAAPSAGRREWTTPTIRRMSAGSAEDGKGTRGDAAFRPS